MRKQKPIPIIQIICVLLFLLASLYYTIIIIDGWVHIPLILTAIVATVVAMINGYKWSLIEQGIISTISKSMQAILILLTVGMLIGTWVLAGIVPAMIYYGLQIMSPSIFLVATCFICAIVSLATGSSWTTAATVGVALIGVGSGLGISLPLVAGAIISGAYFGDKMSPLSDSTNLAPAIVGVNLFEHIRHMVYTVTPSFIIALILYTIIGFSFVEQEANNTAIPEILNGLSANFNISPLLIIPALLVIAMVIFKMPALPGMIIGVIVGGIFAAIFQGASLGDIFNVAYSGFEPNTEISSLDSLLDIGGLEGVYSTVALIICALTMGGVMDSTGMLKTLALRLLKKVHRTGSLVLLTIVTCIVTNIVAADQYLAIIIPGRMYKEMYEDRRLKPKNLSRILEDAGTLTSPLVPWNTCGSYMYTVLGVSPLAYLPYAFLNTINPFVSLFYGITGLTMEKMTEEEYQEILKQRTLTNASIS